MENVFTGRSDARLIKATTVLESTPPERNAPRGTSDIICEETAAARVSRSSSIHSDSLRPDSAVSGGFQ